MRFKHLVLAGTFDHLHLGHQEFIKTAVNQANSVSCGLTTNWINKNKASPFSIQSFQKRLKSVKKFFIRNNIWSKTTIFPLKNPFGAATSDLTMDAIAVTHDSLSGAKLVNQKRKLSNLKPLKILKIGLINASDQKKISSTRIRLGEITRKGFVYHQVFPKNKTFYLPKTQRRYFKKPIGKLLSGPDTNISWASLKALKKIKAFQPHMIITVGDISTHSLLMNNLPINLAIIDNRCQRKPISLNLHQQLKKTTSFHHLIKNSPGTISSMTINIFKKIFPQFSIDNQSGIIQVKGEEDLLVLPAILLSPLKTLIFYGQPNKGLVQIEVTEKIKEKALKLLKKFSY